MAIFKKGDMWERWGKVDLFCITTSGTFQANGSILITDEMAIWPEGLDKELGNMQKSFTESKWYQIPIVVHNNQAIGAFQVRHGINEKNSINLIKMSTSLLFSYLADWPRVQACLNLSSLSGLGNGLEREEVLPIVQLLPDNVEIWEKE